ncbi:MAG: DUF4922 domain-containing protein [Cyclobacteriaceae bacterium]|nr:DUF4922 domain-containing protein [Cyclobacteriaceae bacterium]
MNLSAQARQLIAEQQKNWELARQNYAGLKSVQTRKLAFDGFDITVQFNPERIRSSAAKVDAGSIEARPCFLCPHHRPAAQKSIPVLGKYDLLVNPYPIFPEHLTIVHIDHIGQLIAAHFWDMLDLARMLEEFTVFYNGPKCGASAPDHLHFQAGNKGFLPMEWDFKKGSFFQDARTKNGMDMIRWTAYLRPVFTLSGKNKEQLVEAFMRFYHEMEALQSHEPEPMLNIIAWCRAGRWTIHMFPRKLHRPWQYFETGEKQIVFSPASVDMGGVIILPREEDYRSITMADVQDIYGQVCLDEQHVRHCALVVMD